MIINNDENHEIAWKINENKLQVHNNPKACMRRLQTAIQNQ